MKRKIYQELLRWKNEKQGKTALLIEGARRIGKSYIGNKFSKQVATPYVLHTSDLKVQDSIVYLPLYMTPLL